MAKNKSIDETKAGEIKVDEAVNPHLKNAKILFAGHKDTKELHFTEDGHAFFERHVAQEHAKKNKHTKELVTIQRSDLNN